MLTALRIAAGLLLTQTPNSMPKEIAYPSAHASTPSLPAVVSVAGRAIVSLRAYDVRGTLLKQGSGFLVEKGRVVTNAHVVMGAIRVEVYDFENNLLGTTDYAESVSTRADLAILPPMPDAPGTLRLAAEEPPVGTSLVVIGAPEGLTNTVTTGIVSAFRELEGQRVMQISAPISHGSSGGPVLNPQGEVVGVSVASLMVGQNLNFAVPGRDVRAIVRSPPGRIPLSGDRPTPSAPRLAAFKVEGVKDGRWTRVARSSENTIYLDKTTARRTTSSTIHAWDWSIYNQWQGSGKNRYNNTKNLYEYNCESRRFRSLSHSRFADKELVEGINTPDEWEDWLPGSIGESLANEVCALPQK